VALARSLEPATVVIEDVDLIARERSHALASPLLFALLNAMEGLDGDADVLFVLTTNRPEVLEPALASRPGRVDLAVELPLPDAVARRRLLELYAEGLELDAPDWDAVVAATEGTSPAFVRELMRRAALEAAEAGGRVGTDALLTAVDVLRVQSGRLTATLLGAERPQLDDLADLEDDEDDDDFEIEFDDFGLRP
jgi:ATP-dependent 26S proteasome regulatory subunit